MVLPWSIDSNIDEVLLPFHENVKPLVNVIKSVPDMLTLSHASDASFAHAPKRLIIRGGFVADLWTDMFLEVWKRWCEHTESNEDVRGSGVMWDITSPSKIAEVGEGDTAAHVRKYHHWFSIQGRSVIVTAISLDVMLTAGIIDLTKKVLMTSIKLL